MNVNTGAKEFIPVAPIFFKLTGSAR